MENQFDTLLGSIAILGIVIIGTGFLIYDMYQERKNRNQ